MPNAVGSLKSEVESCFMFEPLVLFALECKGWCSALSAGGAPEARGFWTYNIECSDLTEEGEGLRAHTTSSLSTRILPITTHIITYLTHTGTHMQWPSPLPTACSLTTQINLHSSLHTHLSTCTHTRTYVYTCIPSRHPHAHIIGHTSV